MGLLRLRLPIAQPRGVLDDARLPCQAKGPHARPFGRRHRQRGSGLRWPTAP